MSKEEEEKAAAAAVASVAAGDESSGSDCPFRGSSSSSNDNNNNNNITLSDDGVVGISSGGDQTTTTTTTATSLQLSLTQVMNNLVAEHGMQACRESLELACRHFINNAVFCHSKQDNNSNKNSSNNQSHLEESSRERPHDDDDDDDTKTQQQQQQHELIIMQEEINDSIIDAAFDAMFLINGHGVIQKVNQAAVKQFGYDNKKELLGQNISLLCGDAFSSHHDDYLKSYRDTGKSHIIGTMRQVSARRKDASEFPCKLGINVIVTNKATNEMLICGFIRDLTEELEVIKSHDDLERSMKLNDAIIDASFDAMFLINDYGIIEKVNKAAVIQFGYNNKEELHGRNIHCICGVHYAPHHDRYLEQYRLTRESHIMGSKREVSARRKDGTEFPCQLGLNVMENEDTGEMRMVGFVRDLTTEKLAMDLAVEASLSEQLLMNMLPKEIVIRLKNDPTFLADKHASATMLFADIVGFTSMSSTMQPIEVVELLNNLFSRFDDLVEKYGLNKVKTIGDCYMVTSIPGGGDAGPLCAAVCSFGLDMIEALHEYNNDAAATAAEHHHSKTKTLGLRVGVHSGPVVAGVVGTKRFLYDIWGDAVNLASRMESTGVPGRIQVTPQVVELVPEDDFVFERRGMVHVKGKGEMETYFLEARQGDGTKYYRTG